MSDGAIHRVVVKSDVTAARERIERMLGVTTHVEPIPAYWGGGWVIDFTAPRGVDLDFLRPDVLPPK